MIDVVQGSKLRQAETEEEFLQLIADIPQTNPCPNEDIKTKEHHEWQQELVLELMLNTDPFFDDGGPQNKLIGWIGCLWIDHEESLGNPEGYDWEKDFVCDEGLLVFIIDEAQKEIQKELTRKEGYLRGIKDHLDYLDYLDSRAAARKEEAEKDEFVSS